MVLHSSGVGSHDPEWRDGLFGSAIGPFVQQWPVTQSAGQEWARAVGLIRCFVFARILANSGVSLSGARSASTAMRSESRPHQSRRQVNEREGSVPRRFLLRDRSDMAHAALYSRWGVGTRTIRSTSDSAGISHPGSDEGTELERVSEIRIDRQRLSTRARAAR